MKNTIYELIVVICNIGYNDMVMDAARQAGATGGTIIHARGTARKETEDFLDRVYHGSVGLLMSAITRKQQLSKEEIDELYAILQQAEEAKES